MKKYQSMFLKRYKHMLDEWKQKPSVSNQELYRFLHSIKGTASSIELHHLTETSSELLEQIDKDKESIWKIDEWVDFIQPLALLFDEDIEDPIQVKGAVDDQTSQKTILVLNNDIDLLNYIKENLEDNNYKVFIATTLNRGTQLFYDRHPDLVICDYHIKNKRGLDFLKNIEKNVLSTFTPVLIISDDVSQKVKKKVYDANAYDFIEKPIQMDVFLSIIRNRLRQKEMFKKRVMVDELTSAYNRVFLNDKWKELHKNFKEKGTPFSFALLDLDRFKQVNDKYGHAVGDTVLAEFSQFILRNIRSSDNLVRYGGEEFLLILQETKQDDGIRIVQRLLEEFMAEKQIVNGISLSLSFTSGVSEMKKSIQSLEQLIIQSDLALYYGKQNGRKSVHGYHPELQKNSELVKKHNLLRIAIVDDDRVIQQLLQDYLSKMTISNFHIEVRAFREGESFLATSWYKQAGNYIILLDGIMPGMDGLEVLSELRKTENEKDMGIIMLTGRQKDEDIVKALELGADDYITKPFSLQQLEARVKRLINRLF
ncbi:response regulator [Aquibacillus koreensis]|uniref:Response regulator n=1 Tax=Aquibacillus koreensis TaxID=279446 RepID=A0A9X3WHX9_9BACI|nr:response regulator [Aquibacillus koreensis]MCT2535623.1 response regulator [Aquibacillus koreensis]MDC3420092.1 response regulator [Aquibacillus koreensis]